MVTFNDIKQNSKWTEFLQHPATELVANLLSYNGPSINYTYFQVHVCIKWDSKKNTIKFYEVKFPGVPKRKPALKLSKENFLRIMGQMKEKEKEIVIKYD